MRHRPIAGKSLLSVVTIAEEMSHHFGTLESTQDAYFWVNNNNRIGRPYGEGTNTEARNWSTPGAGQICGTAFSHNLYQGVATFITYAEYDGAVCPPSIADAINTPVFPSYDALCEASATNDIGDSSRPGRIFVFALPQTPLYITMPHYFSGYGVPMHEAPSPGQAHQLREDVRRWLLNTRK